MKSIAFLVRNEKLSSKLFTEIFLKQIIDLKDLHLHILRNLCNNIYE